LGEVIDESSMVVRVEQQCCTRDGGGWVSG